MSGHKHATDRVDGTIVAECPNKENADDMHLKAEVEYSDAADTTMIDEFVEAFEECGKCGAELDYIGHEVPSEVLD